MKQYDCIAVGGGSGGIAFVNRAASYGKCAQNLCAQARRYKALSLP